MRTGFIGAAALSAVSTLLVLPAVGVAEGGFRVIPGSAAAIFFLRGEDDYAMQLTLSDRELVLQVRKGNVAAAYVAPAEFSETRIRARIGSLGRVSIRLDPDAFREGPRRGRHCRGRPPRLGIGEFRGLIRFRGEDGYTSVDTHSAFGFVARSYRTVCRRGPLAGAAARGPAPLTTRFSALSRRKGKLVAFELRRREDARRAAVSAVTLERRPRLTILRAATTVVGGEEAFLVSDPGERPAFAAVKPPKPFSGFGIFAEAGGSSSWTGSLTAWLPGAGHVSVAGSRFASNLCRRPPEGPSCGEPSLIRRPLALLQGSGSQSQVLADARLSWSR